MTSESLDTLALRGPLLLIGGVHGDEPEGIIMAEECLKWLFDDARKPQPEVRIPWAVIPVLNPDGAIHQTRVNGTGVDLNRNYPSKNWSAEAKAPRYNPGPFAGSEPEIKALVNLIQQLKPRLIIHCHSWNPCIVATGAPALRAAQSLANASGYKIVDDIGYPTPGSLSEYAWHDRQIPVICIEEQDHIDLKTVWPRFSSGFIEIFKRDSVP